MFAVVDESVRGVPVLDDVEAFVDLAAELEGGEVVAHNLSVPSGSTEEDQPLKFRGVQGPI